MYNNLEKQERKGSSGIRKKAALTAAGVLVAAAELLGTDHEAKPVSANADTPTPTATRTATPIPTSTPDAREQQIAALQTAVAKSAKERKQDEQIADLKKQLTPTDTPSPTKTPTAFATPDRTATQQTLEAQEVAKIRSMPTATGTATPDIQATVTTAVRTELGKSNAGNQDGGIPVVPLAAAAAAGAAGWANRRRAWNFARTQSGRAITAIRTRLHI